MIMKFVVSNASVPHSACVGVCVFVCVFVCVCVCVCVCLLLFISYWCETQRSVLDANLSWISAGMISLHVSTGLSWRRGKSVRHTNPMW